MTEYLTPCFHLDSRILNGSPTGIENGAYYVEEDNNKQFVSVDGITGYNWITVSRNETTQYGIEPRIGIEDVMDCTIYEDKSARKFTVCFYGGWDGWDYYRTSRSNSDEFRYNKYKGKMGGVNAKFVYNEKVCDVKIGSGWSDKDREYLFDNPEEIEGKVITISFFEITKNSSTNNYSLRFPTVTLPFPECIRTDKTTLDDTHID